MIDILIGIMIMFSTITACYYWKDKLNIKTKEELEYEKRWEDCD